MTLVLLSILLSSCTHTSPKDESFKKMMLIVNYPLNMIQEKGLVNDNLLDTIFIFNFMDYSVYQLPPNRFFETNARIDGTEPIFVIKKNSKFGLSFQNVRDSSSGVKLLADSFLNNRAFGNARFSVTPFDSLVKTIGIPNSGHVIEMFISKVSSPNDYFDSVYHYYSGGKGYMNLDYTFSEKLDSLKGMKLYKVRLLYNEKYSNEYKVTLPKREFLFNVEPVALSKADEDIKKLFQRIKTDSVRYSF